MPFPGSESLVSGATCRRREKHLSLGLYFPSLLSPHNIYSPAPFPTTACPPSPQPPISNLQREGITVTVYAIAPCCFWLRFPFRFSPHFQLFNSLPRRILTVPTDRQNGKKFGLRAPSENRACPPLLSCFFLFLSFFPFFSSSSFHFCLSPASDLVLTFSAGR